MVVDLVAADVAAELGLVAVVGAVSAYVARRLNQPTVVGFLVGGILVGPVLGILAVGPVLETLGEFGIALLLFLVGIGLSFQEVRAVGPPAVVAGLGQLTGSAVGGYFLALALGFDHGTALFLAAALAFSSTVVVVKILLDMGDLHATYGRLAVGIFLVQDIVVILLLTVLPVLGDGGAVAPTMLAREGGVAIAQMGLLVALALVARRSVLPVVFRYSAAQPQLLFLLGLVWLFAAVALTAFLAVSLEVGAFVAGLSLAALPYAQELSRRVRPLLDLFIALFFVSLAAGVSLDAFTRLLPGALAFSAFVLVGNAVVLTLVLGLMRYPRETSLRAGITVGQVSEFSIVLAALALAQDLITPDVRDFVILVSMLTIAASAVLIWRSRDIHRLLERFRFYRALPAGERGVEGTDESRRDHVLLLGWDALAPGIADALLARGERVVVLDANEDVPDRLPSGVEGIYADPEDIDAIEHAGLMDARLVVANLSDPGLVRVLLTRVDKRIPVVARADDPDAEGMLQKAGAIVYAPAELVAQAALRHLQEVPPRGR